MKLFLVVAFVLIAGSAHAEPAAQWQDADPAALGWSLDKLKTAEDQAGVSPTVVVMIVEGDRVVARWGDVTRKSARACWRRFMARQSPTDGSSSTRRSPILTSTTSRRA